MKKPAQSKKAKKESTTASVQPEIKLDMESEKTEEQEPQKEIQIPDKEKEQDQQTQKDDSQSQTPSVQGDIKTAPDQTPAISSENKEESEKEDKTEIGGDSPESADDKFAIFDEEDEKPKANILKIGLLFVLGFVVGGVSVGAILYFSPFQKSEPKQEEASTEQEMTAPEKAMKEENKEATESAEVEEELDLSAYAIQVLNGSGVSGAAGAVQKVLEGSGFENFDLGNADSYDYKDTEVQIISGLPKGVYDEIEKALEDYNVVLSEENLSEDSEYDVVIIAGQKK